MASRFVVDKSSGTHLVFPDVLEFEIQTGENEDEIVTVTVQAQLTAGGAVDDLPDAREIALTSPFFVLRRPSDEAVVEFQFVRGDGLSGTAILLLKAAELETVLSKIKTNPSYFDPEYSGTSEPFASIVEIASVALDEHRIEAVRMKSSAAKQISELMKSVSASVDEADKPHVLELTDKLLAQGDFERNESVWRLVLSPGAKKAGLNKIEEAVVQIRGTSKEISL
ncbi:MAG: hypothetical protein KDK12_00730 [Rhodobacteraceae bacterium]|nr:hypothetical protein [Paracoccaceae bacterium]